MKGIHPVLSHTTLLLIGLIAMSLIIVSISSLFSKTEKDLVTSEINYIAESTKNKILEIYNMANQTTEYINGTFQLNLPETIGDKKYTLILNQNNLTVLMPFENENIEVNRTLNIDAQLNGESYLPASIEIEKTGGIITMNLVG
jgi:glyceraldehyde-3-phosphate dehydrogenase/erythrose-4-phosphate dehydrogenase